MKKYEVFGYIMSCNTKLPLPEYEGAKEAELEIWLEPKEQAVPAEYCLKSEFQIEENGPMDKCLYYEHDSEKWICYQNVCDICIVAQKNRILCYYRNPDNLQLAILYLLSDVISTWLRTAGWYVFHAAALNINDQNIMLCADKGSGKSTLLMSLCNCGGRILSDDLTAVCSNGEKTIVRSSFPSVKLYPLQFGLSEGLICAYEPVLKNSAKKNCTLIPEAFIPGDHPLDCVYHIHPVSVRQELSFRKLSPMEGFVTLLKSIFSGTTSSTDELINYQKLIRKIVSTMPVYCLDIPRNLMLLPDIVELVCQNSMK